MDREKLNKWVWRITFWCVFLLVLFIMVVGLDIYQGNVEAEDLTPAMIHGAIITYLGWIIWLNFVFIMMYAEYQEKTKKLNERIEELEREVHGEVQEGAEGTEETG